ncbi:MAG: peptidoglycan-binding protein [Rhizobiaceae bacterium]
MNTKRSYIESLNAGRQRRERASLEDLNRSLASLDERFGRSLRETENEVGERTRSVSGGGRSDSGSGRERPASDFPHDFRQDRGSQGGVASIGRIASELNALREELRSRVEGVSREGDPETASLAQAAAVGRARPRGMIGETSQAPGAPDMGALSREMATIREAVEALTRDDTAHLVGRRLDAVEARLSGVGDEMIAGIADRLEQINGAVAALSDSLASEALDEKMRALATAVEHLARQRDMPGAATFAAIEERLDEISRAIAATSAQPASGFDNEHLARVEARIASLSRQLEELVEDRPVDAVVKQLNALSARIDDIADRAEMPESAVERLSHQIDLISRKLEEGTPAFDPGMVLEGIEKRFDMLTQALEQRHETAREQSVALFRDLEERLERYNQDALSTDATIVEALNKRFSDLEEAVAQQGGIGPQAVRALEERLNDLADKLGRYGDHPGAIDPDLVRNLESQVEGLTARLSKPGKALPEFDDIGPRLELIERSLMESREAIVVAAREAAEHAVRSRDLPEGDVAALTGLAEDLRSLEGLARTSDERNGRTFEAIHDTLLQIVDRLGALESGAVPSAARAEEKTLKKASAPRLEFAEAPSLDMGDAEPLLDASGTMPKGEVVRDPKRSPAEAAAAAAQAALSSSEAGPAKPDSLPRKSRLGKLSRALSRKKQRENTVEERQEPTPVGEAAGETASEAGLDTPLDPKLANQPLEPGSGAPDINAIMRRVRDERGEEGRARDAEAAKSDFIAAARRAAQAAAAEAEVLKKKSDPKGPARRLGLKRLLRSNTKIVVLAAGVVLVGVAGAQLGKALMKEQAHKPVVAKAEAARPANAGAARNKGVAETKADSAKKVAVLSPVLPLPGDAIGTEEPPATVKPAPMTPPTATARSIDADASSPRDMTPATETAKLVPAVAPEPAPTAAASAVKDAGGDSARPAVAPSPQAASLKPAAEDPKAEAPAAPAPAARMPIPDDAGPLPLREAAEGGDPKALFEIGTRYAEGRGVAADPKTAAKWYEEAAGLGFAPAEYRIGNFYEKGIGVDRDIAKAEEWYRKAAGQGNAAAMHNLGVLHAMGADGPVDNEAAVRWFEKAAELGVKDSQFNLGILAAKGVGMPQNLEESYKWFALVAKSGDKDAQAKRDEVANSLRPEQLQRARAAVELWKARPVDVAANVVDVPDAWREGDTKTAGIDMKQAVRNIQLILGKNGYDPGTPDGVMGDKTKSAIAAFQKANGMEPTGEVNEALVTALLKKK